jgi:CBS domain containing-hemolysin-like protein
MPAYFYVAAVAFATLVSLLFATLNYSLRNISRLRLEQYLQRHGSLRWLEPTIQYRDELMLVTAVGRLIANTLIALTIFDALIRSLHQNHAFWLAAAISLALTFFFSVALPQALAEIAGPGFVGAAALPLHLLRKALAPFASITNLVETRVQNTVGGNDLPEPDKIEEELLSVVEEGEKEGVVDKQERVMIESAIGFRDMTAGQIMTPRADIEALSADSTLEQIQAFIEKTGHSRIPVFRGSLDQIVGILYARDLLHLLGKAPVAFDIKSITRPAFFIPETKTLRDLLHDFRLQKIHIAVVLDEYGGTAGLVTIEDMLEELLGEISDEHEPQEAPMFRRIDDQNSEADARLPIDQLNRLTGLSVPEDAGYETLGGFISTTLGRIPKAGTVLEHSGAKFTVLAAEPQKVNRLRIELLPVQQPVA